MALVTACGSNLRREVVGQGVGTVQPRGYAVDAPAQGIALARGTYELALHFDVPRAQMIDYSVVCGGVTIPGQVGETFEAYRTRRLAELRAMVERDRRRVAAATQAVGAAAPTVQVHGGAPGGVVVAPGVYAQGQAGVSGGVVVAHGGHPHGHVAAPGRAVVGQAPPNGRVVASGGAAVETTISGRVVGETAATAVAEAAIEDIVELAPGDVGAGRLHTKIHLRTSADGTCTVHAVAEDADVRLTYDVTRIRDLDAEARERRMAANASAVQVRGSLTAQLAVYGADPLALQRRRDAEARARLEAEAARAQARAEADRVRAKASAEAEARRAELRAKAEAERDRARAKARAEAEARRAELRAKEDRARARAEAERAAARLRARAELDAKIAIEVRRRDSAMHTRGLLIAYLAGECAADPHKRERERAAVVAQREERELKIRLELEARAERDARLRAEREASEARLRAEREARLQLELEARAERDARLRAERDARDAKARAEREARDAKARAEREARLQLELEARAERDARLRAEREARLQLELEARRARQAEQHRRIEVALGVRAELQAYLVSLGATQRPPMPALVVENPGIAPFAGAVWIAGHWQWTGGQWLWVAGGWSDTTMFGSSGSAGGSVSIGVSAGPVIAPPVYTDPTIREHPDVPVTAPAVRDHRGSSEPTVRDHRGSRGSSEPTVRDHRKSDDTRGDDQRANDKPVVRDHRKR